MSSATIKASPTSSLHPSQTWGAAAVRSGVANAWAGSCTITIELRRDPARLFNHTGEIMYPKAIEFYFAPKDMGEVLTLLKQHGAHAKLLAGGQSLIPLMKLRLVEPRAVIDLNRVSGLSEIREENRTLRLGAMVRHADVAAHPLIQRSYSLLAEAARNIGDPQVRNRGTLAGSLVHADPAADYPPAVIALNGRIVLAKASESIRIVSADDFIAGPLTSAIAADELVTRIEIPTPLPRSGGAYAKHSQVAGDFAIISVAAHVTLDPAGTC